MKLLSVIVPIYNAASYLHRCLNSLLSQTYTQFELILVDDGSTDDTYSVCAAFAERDKRVRLFRKENGGVSSARNLGLQQAQGDYVCWVDADDYVSPEYLSSLAASIKEDTDLVIHALTRIDPSGVETIAQGAVPGLYDLSKTAEQQAFFEGVNLDHLGVSVSKAFRLSLIRQYDLKYSTNIRLAEDLDFLYRYLIHCIKINVEPTANYFYLLRPDSVSKTFYDFEVEAAGKEQIASSCQILQGKYSSTIVDCLAGSTIAAYIHRMLLSCYKPGVSRRQRFCNFQQFTELDLSLYRKFGPKETLFLKVLNTLFVQRHFVSLDCLMLFVYRLLYKIQ